jgi:hypothetical protein
MSFSFIILKLRSNVIIFRKLMLLALSSAMNRLDFNLSHLTIAIKKSANAAKVKIANARSNIDDSIATPNTSSFEIITFTENIPKAIDTKRRRFVFRFWYAFKDKAKRIPANGPVPNSNMSDM